MRSESLNKVPRFRVTPRDKDSHRVISALQKLYRTKLRPIEEEFSFDRFHYDVITDTELEAKSQVLVIGQYSTGKTTFIRHLLGADFPNMNIGPEPTTDKFTVVLHGEEDRPVEGNSLAVIKELPYEGLTRFGTGFLNKLDAAVSTSPFLEHITLVDTPGVLSGEMQKHQRAYKFADVARWFAERSDMILILFDAHHLDVSQELMEILMSLKDRQSIIRIVLNKADQVDKARLRRVYGALMWAMGKVFDNPEVVRVYVGSFWDRPLKHTAHEKLFKADQDALTKELTDLPRLSAIRKINQLIRRTNLVRGHACVLSHLGEEMPWLFGRAKRQQELLDDLEGVIETVRTTHDLHEADMPDAQELRRRLHSFDFSKFPVLTPATLRQLHDVVHVGIHKVLNEGGGSEKIFKFLRGGAPAAGPSLLTRAASSARSLWYGKSTSAVDEGATYPRPSITFGPVKKPDSPSTPTRPGDAFETAALAAEESTPQSSMKVMTEDASARDGSGRDSEDKRSSGMTMIWLVLTVFLLLAIGGGAWLAIRGGGGAGAFPAAFREKAHSLLAHTPGGLRRLASSKSHQTGGSARTRDDEEDVFYTGTIH